MDYSSFDTERWAKEAPKNPSRTDFERDRARVLHSSALRRLGAKTQVLGPESNDFIRTRLTHSLEVAQIGRSLAKNLGADQDMVEAACLSHDIGHPPFGHNGEQALNEISKSFGGFEGNAQTLRVITRLEPKRFHPDGRPAGLNLTRATVDATIKYPWRSGERDTPKFGAYSGDVPAFEWVRGSRHGQAQCAEAQIMDLSDDIAYSVHDLEDAIVRGKLDPQRLREMDVAGIIDSTIEWYGEDVSGEQLEGAARRLLAMDSWPASYSGSLRDLAQLKDLTSDLIGRFILAVCTQTRESYGDAPLIRYNGSLAVPAHTKAEITFLKGLAVYFVMAPRESEPVYYEQRTLLMDLMDALVDNPDRLEPHLRAQYLAAGTDDARARVVVDQIASLTDQSARAWHSLYCGMLRN